MNKMGLKDKLEDDELDLSLMQLTDIPVKDIEKLGNKVLKLNVSHNLLTLVPGNLPLLTHLTAIDLSKNKIKELPENFGQLVKLRSLDLYCNEIEKLPVSFAQLKSLKWLDLKENPLVPELAKAAGPCITKMDCEQAAKRVVARLQSIESQLFQERKKRLEAEEKIRRQKEKEEEAERERLRAEKKLAKEKRREEARLRDLESKDQLEGDKNNVQINGMPSPKKGPIKNGRLHDSENSGSTAGFSCFGFLLKLMMLVSFCAVATGVFLLWVYTDGKMDSESIKRAVPIIQRDVETNLLAMGKKSEKFYKDVEKSARPYVKQTLKTVGDAYKEASVKANQGYNWVEDNYGDSLRHGYSEARIHLLQAWQATKLWALEAWQVTKHLSLIAWEKVYELYQELLPTLVRFWLQVEPYFEKVGRHFNAMVREAVTAIQTNLPVYIEWVNVTWEKIYAIVHQYIIQLVA
eukprot:TRINITY_DN4567_c0_g1_i2.p1 TRINITY_DN4567_c0_g1~~TRINITY_DN4567_c0_g1_i2.p1  ORF type:complete len:463 (+),score=146.17 TRINITY_DN4567_c0_g1_i2:48-1436(+)